MRCFWVTASQLKYLRRMTNPMIGPNSPSGNITLLTYRTTEPKRLHLQSLNECVARNRSNCIGSEDVRQVTYVQYDVMY